MSLVRRVPFTLGNIKTLSPSGDGQLSQFRGRGEEEGRSPGSSVASTSGLHSPSRPRAEDMRTCIPHGVLSMSSWESGLWEQFRRDKDAHISMYRIVSRAIERKKARYYYRFSCLLTRHPYHWSLMRYPLRAFPPSATSTSVRRSTFQGCAIAFGCF